MSGVKEVKRKGIENLEQNKEQLSEVAEKITDQAEMVFTTLDGIQVNYAEDREIIVGVREKYVPDFYEEFEADVENPGDELENEAIDISDEMGAEAESVMNAANQVSEVKDMADVGKEAAEQGADELEASSNEFSDISDEAKEKQKEIEEMKKSHKSDLEKNFKKNLGDLRYVQTL